MTPRRLVPVVLDGSVETAQKVPPPRIGDLVTYAVSFSEAGGYADPADPTLTTLTVRVEPGRGGEPFRDPCHDGTPFEQRPRWSSVLHADGWAAQWVSFRPPPSEPGPVELRGRVSMDFGALCPCWIRGRIARIWLTYGRRNRPFDHADPATWECARGSHGRIPIDEVPTAGSGRDWPPLPSYANWSQRLVELDLDAVPDGRTGGASRPRD